MTSTNPSRSTAARRLPLALLVLAAACASAEARAELDRSGEPREGEASYYGPGFAGKPMADGTPMDPQSDNAASRTLPLGTTARITNLENGRSAVVEIRDRGPYVDGRIVDVTPKTADELGFRHDGVAPVKVEPLALPPPKTSGER